jgi:hypothetical protein
MFDFSTVQFWAVVVILSAIFITASFSSNHPSREEKEKIHLFLQT